MIFPFYYFNATPKIKKSKREFLVVARAREGWGKGNTFSCGAFCEAKNEIRRRRKSEGGQKFLPPSPLPFCPPERKLSKVSVRIFAKKSSDFVQDRQPICKVSVSRLARGFAPRFGKRIFKQFPNEPIFCPAFGGTSKRQFSAQKRLQI